MAIWKCDVCWTLNDVIAIICKQCRNLRKSEYSPDIPLNKTQPTTGGAYIPPAPSDIFRED